MAKKFILSSGMPLLVEYMPQLHSVTAGIWVRCGSVYENPATSGVSHFLEHMLFKGTPSRSSLDISTEMEAVGGVLNAFTGKEHTCYYTRCLDEHFERGLSLLADMYQNPRLDEADFAKEKSVILEEINMYEDSPDEVAMDLFVRTLFPSHTYGKPIAGTIDSVTALTVEQLREHFQAFYTPANCVLAIAGNIPPEQAYQLAETLFASGGGIVAPKVDIPKAHSGTAFIAKDIEQSHLCMGFPSVPLGDADYYPAAIIANALGGGASSRLFQEVREKHGLAYSAYCYLEAYSKCGFMMAYAATAPKNANQLTQVIAEQLHLLRQKGVTDEEVSRSKDQLKGSLMLSLESTANVMSRLGRYQLALGKIYNPEDAAAKIAAVTPDDVARLVEKIVVPEQLVMAQVGSEQCQLNIKELI